MFRNVLRILLILLAFVVVRYVIYAVRKALSSAPQRAGTATPPSPGSEHLFRDPVCGAFIPGHGTLTASSGGVTHHFCSVACRDKFLAA
jgi:YHS domain-containing protein